ncbi:hypothetical protein PoB_000048900 [Plakobranchus ocellatus]|uniref:TLDc domain-containing protein n=1 Tax=Plakobranchus ocellatus TaxID=259542 RepID=A0AAV3XVL0_9GAST|nr:hypothetical protein PoB_000048900 [Plakobranchus ocellatus]
MATPCHHSEEQQEKSIASGENVSSETPPQELSPDDEDTNLLLRKSEAHSKVTKEAAQEIQSSAKPSARSSLISFAAAPSKSKLFDKSLGDRSIKHSILKDSSEDESLPPDTNPNKVKTDLDQTSLHVVSTNASQFGFGSSNSDFRVTFDTEADPASGDKDKTDQSPPVEPKENNAQEKSLKGTNKKVESKKNGKSRDSKSSIEQGNVTIESSGSVAFFNASPSSKYNRGDKDAETSLLQSPQRSDISSEDDSPFLNTSEEADNFLSPSNASDDGLGVCSKYSQLSEDGSSPSSPEASAKLMGTSGITVDVADDSERKVFEHSLELGIAFSEFVDVDSFKASLGNKNPHTEDGFGGRSEEHLVALLQSGATKNLKSYLRNSQWPAESDARHNQWLNLCGHLLKAGGGLYQELAKDVITNGSEDILSLPAFIDRDHLHSYYLNQHGINTSREVVMVIANISPDIIYCPLLYPLACVFLHYMTPEACFDCLQALLASNKFLYLAQARVNNEATALVLRDLAKKYAKQAYVLIVNSSKNVDAVFENWIWWIFKDLSFQFLHGINTSREVVMVIANISPDIIYCPLLYPLACVFLHYMTPEACFDCLQALLASNKFLYLAQARVNNEATALVLRDLAKKYAKQAYVLIVNSSKNVDAVFENWIWWIFKDLSFQFLVRIIDSYLLEGYKVFFRVALSILILFTKDSNKRGSRNSPVTNISAAISRFCSNMPYEPRKLIKAGFSIRGLNRREIQKLQAKHESHLRSVPASDQLPGVASSLSVGQTSTSRSFTGPAYLLNTKTKILSPEMLHTLWGWIPIRLTLKKLELLFSSNVDGTTLRTLYMRTQHAPQTLLIIKATDGSIFGAYCSAAWSIRLEKNIPHMSFFGTGETFVFTLYPDLKKFPWIGTLGSPSQSTSDHFMAGNDDMMIIGSGNGEAIYLDSMMNHCRSTHCDTFDNEPLCQSQDFSCQVVEVFEFVD